MILLAYKLGDISTRFRYKTMISRIKVSRKEFNAACAGGCVYGQFQGRRNIYVYAECGKELTYVPKLNDDPKTSYRLFVNCDVFFAKSVEQLNASDFEMELSNSTIIIYC